MSVALRFIHVMISTEFSRSVFDDAFDAIQDTDHPCHHMVQWQFQNGFHPFQLPEPFSGRRSSLGLAFMGLNPSIGAGAVIPTDSPEWTFEAYDDYYRSRFDERNRDARGRLLVHRADHTTKRSKLWNQIESFGCEQLSSVTDARFRLGDHAVLLEAVRYKSRDGWLGDTANERQRVTDHQADFTRDLLDRVDLRVLIAMGKDAWDQLDSVLQFVGPPVPQQVTRAMGTSYTGATSLGTRVTVVPVTHFSQRYPPYEVRCQVGRLIRKALDGSRQ